MALFNTTPSMSHGILMNMNNDMIGGIGLNQIKICKIVGINTPVHDNVRPIQGESMADQMHVFNFFFKSPNCCLGGTKKYKV